MGVFSVGAGLTFREVPSGGDTVVLEANRQYYARVRAKAKDFASNDSPYTTSQVSTFTAVLGPVTPVVVESSSTLTVTWEDEGGGVKNAKATPYVIEWKEETEGAWTSGATIDGNSLLELAAETLTANTTYNLRLTAMKASGSNWPSETWEGTRVTLATVPVVGPFTTYTTSGTVTWDGNGNPDGTEYEVKVADNEGFDPSLGPPSDFGVLSATFTLTPNTTYWAAIRAKNHEGKWTADWAYWAPKPTDPAMPLVKEGDFKIYTDSCTVQWEANGNPSGTRYHVMVTDNGDFNNPTYSQDVNQTSDPMSLDFTGLTSNKSHSMRVDVVGHNGKVLASHILGSQTAPAPIVILDLTPTGDTTRELQLSWNVNTNSSETQYVAQLSTDPAFGVGGLSVTTEPNGTEHTFEDLDSNQLYYAHVKAETAGSFSRDVTTTTWPSSPENLGAGTVDVSFNTHRIAFVWDHGNNAPETTRYEVAVSSTVGNQNYFVKSLTTAFGEKQIEFKETDGILWANQKYLGTVRALAIDGQNSHSSALTETSAYTAPLAPQSLAAVGQTTGTITISWIAPSLSTVDGNTVSNSPGTDFQVNWGLNSGTESQYAIGTGSVFNVTLGEGSPLTPNATYFIEVVTIRGEGNSFPSERTRLLPAPATDPNAPLIDVAWVTVHQTSMTVVWDINGNAMGSTYKFRFYDFESATWVRSYQTTLNPFTTPADLLPASKYRLEISVIGLNKDLVGNNLITKITKTANPVIDSVNKLNSVGGKQQLQLFWSSGSNGKEVIYNGALNGTGWTTDEITSPFVFGNLLPNEKYSFWIRAYNGAEPGYSFASTSTWTRAEAPLAPTVVSPLVGNAMGIGFPETGNPMGTEYAIRIVTTNPSVPILPTPYAELVNPEIPGEAQFTSGESVWLSTAGWLRNGKLQIFGLPEEEGYRIVLISRNHMLEEEVSENGLDITQTAGIPLVTLETAQGLLTTNVMSQETPVYLNSSTVPFRAANSSHYNVRWGTDPLVINGSALAETRGWNGEFNPNVKCITIDESKSNSLYNEPLGGFCAEEGVYYLSVAGTAIIDSILDTNNIVSTSPFRVYIDMTPPVPPELKLSFKDIPFEPLLQDTLYGNPTPYFVWGSNDPLGNDISRSPVLGWTTSVSTDSAVRPVRSTDPAQGFIPFVQNPGISVDLHSVTVSSATVYYRVRAYDQAGNWTPDNDLPEFRYLYTPDQILPELAGVQLDGKLFPAIDKTVRYAAVTPQLEFVHVTFSEPMLIPSNSFQLTLLRGPDGTLMNRTVSLDSVPTNQATSADGKQILPFTSSETLEPGSLYRFKTSTSPVPTDRANNPLSAGLDLLFYTAMDPALPAIFSSEMDEVSVKVDAFALGNEQAGVAINDRPDKVSVAGSPSLSRLLGDANDALGRQTGGSFKKILLAKELTVFKTNGEMRTQAYGEGVQLVFDYSKPLEQHAQTAGRPLKPKDLVIYELDERTGVWSKMPNARVDENLHVVSVPLRHNGTYGMGSEPNYDLSSAHPYPVPYRPAQHAHGISFTGLSSFGTIKIYTLDGRLVKTIRFDGESSVAWDPVQSDSGDTVASDVYLYTIENDQQRIVGKLMVIR